MQVQVVPLSDFIHGQINAREGHAQLMEAGLAEELERAGLVRIKMAPAYANKMMSEPVNKGKAEDDGPGLPSSVLPADPASRTLTLPALKTGGDKRQRTGM